MFCSNFTNVSDFYPLEVVGREMQKNFQSWSKIILYSSSA